MEPLEPVVVLPSENTGGVAVEVVMSNGSGHHYLVDVPLNSTLLHTLELLQEANVGFTWVYFICFYPFWQFKSLIRSTVGISAIWYFYFEGLARHPPCGDRISVLWMEWKHCQVNANTGTSHLMVFHWQRVRTPFHWIMPNLQTIIFILTLFFF